MSYADQNPYQASFGMEQFAAAAAEDERTTFIRRTYAHLAGAVALFVLIEVVIFKMVPAQTLQETAMWMLGEPWHWLVVLGAFMLVSVVADRWARSSTSLGVQYAGLGLYVVCEAVIFVPLLLIADRLGAARGQNLIATAAVMTLIVFAGLTMLVFVTRADFSWLGKYLGLAAFVLLGFIICALMFDMQLGDWFAGLMVALAAGYILFYTSNILHHYRLNQYVAASLALFASVALLFWYILQLVMSRD